MGWVMLALLTADSSLHGQVSVETRRKFLRIKGSGKNLSVFPVCGSKKIIKTLLMLSLVHQ